MTPNHLAASLELEAEDQRRRKEWLDGLRDDGIRAAHPADAWVDWRKREVLLCYPYFEVKPVRVGDRIALGDERKHRVVTVTKIVPCLFAFLQDAKPTYQFVTD